jgi:hypothetical protein
MIHGVVEQGNTTLNNGQIITFFKCERKETCKIDNVTTNSSSIIKRNEK